MATVCVTYDFDGVAPWIWNYKLPGSHKQGVFGADVGTPRLLDLHDTHDIPSTWFIPGHTIESFPEASKDVRDRGHEIQHHTWSHAPRPSYDTRSAEESDLVRGIETLEELTGERPIGFRASAGGLSEFTIELLEEYDFEWIASDKERDFEPYYIRKNPSLPRNGPYERGEKTDLVNVPHQWQRDDWLQMGPTQSSPDPQQSAAKGPLMSDKAVFERWRREFDWMVENMDNGVFVMLLHPQISGRASTVSLLDGFFDHVHESDAQFADVSTVVEEFKSRGNQ
jgi:peptidoglycan/xylan/chitin deacetylase (PgdA/CDA1 family)